MDKVGLFFKEGCYKRVTFEEFDKLKQQNSSITRSLTITLIYQLTPIAE